MAADRGLVSPTKLQKLAQHHQTLNNPSSSSSSSSSSTTTTTTTISSSSWMWNPKQPTGEDDDSWEARAFTEDTNQAMGTTWPPRSYTCTFCRREFRSAQALGGHMNVHRRDRARLHQAPTGPTSPTSPSAAYSYSSSSTLIIPTQELVANGTGLCLLYSLPNPKDILSPTTMMNTSTDSSSNLLSISPYPPKNLISSPCPPPPINFPVAWPSTTTEPSGSIDDDNNQNHNGSMITGELDLELRLGRSSSPS